MNCLNATIAIWRQNMINFIKRILKLKSVTLLEEFRIGYQLNFTLNGKLLATVDWREAIVKASTLEEAKCNLKKKLKAEINTVMITKLWDERNITE